MLNLPGGEGSTLTLAIDNHNNTEQEQSANTLLNPHPEREESRKRGDDYDGYQHESRDNAQAQISTARAASHLGGKGGCEQRTDDDNGATNPDGWWNEFGVAAQEEGDYQGEHANSEIAANKQLYIAQGNRSGHMICMFFNQIRCFHSKILLLHFLELMVFQLSALLFGKLDVLSIAGNSRLAPVPSVTNHGSIFLLWLL
jgi:hypothetical protein